MRNAPLVEQVVEPLHRLRVDEFIRQGAPKKRERLKATNDPSVNPIVESTTPTNGP